MDNRSLNWIDSFQAPNAVTSMNVKFLLYMLQIIDFQQSLREIAFQTVCFSYNNKYILIFLWHF